MMIGGVGVGLMIPSLTGAVASTLAPARLATGIGAGKLEWGSAAAGGLNLDFI